jgi:hypothetical protein
LFPNFIKEKKDIFVCFSLLYFILFLSLFIYPYVHKLCHFSPVPPVPSISPPLPSLPGSSCSGLSSNFVEE